MADRGTVLPDALALAYTAIDGIEDEHAATRLRARAEEIEAETKRRSSSLVERLRTEKAAAEADARRAWEIVRREMERANTAERELRAAQAALEESRCVREGQA